MTVTQLAIVSALLGLWAAALWWRYGPPTITALEIKFTHVLPASLQIVLYSYWALFWPPLLRQFPVIVLQLVIAYGLDVLLSWTLRRQYTPSFGPVPIVLSMNLFVWFPDLVFITAITTMALASKALLRVHGRHIFNPAVFGVTVAAILCIGLPQVFRYQDVSHDFDRPPAMALLIFFLALIPQIRLGITPVALGAAVTMLAMNVIVYSVTGYRGAPTPWWPAWLLAITLLAGDPATIPSTSVARLLFGVFLGVASYAISRAMLFSVGTDFFSKILPIALANLMLPAFERAGARLSLRLPKLAAASNRAYVATWIFFCVLTVIVRSS